jgi:hypothetical protein
MSNLYPTQQRPDQEIDAAAMVALVRAMTQVSNAGIDSFLSNPFIQWSAEQKNPLPRFQSTGRRQRTSGSAAAHGARMPLIPQEQKFAA